MKRASKAHGAVRQSLAAAGLLAAAEGATGPDAELIQACEECLSARASADAYWHASHAPRVNEATRAELRQRAAAARARCDELEAWIIAKPARTVEGARAKLRCAIDLGADGRGGKVLHLPCAAMADALRLIG
jgi:hypothetical protein